jgi:hypothetical protein
MIKTILNSFFPKNLTKKKTLTIARHGTIVCITIFAKKLSSAVGYSISTIFFQAKKHKKPSSFMFGNRLHVSCAWTLLWMVISKKLIKNLVDGMLNRIRAVIVVEGGPTKYKCLKQKCSKTQPQIKAIWALAQVSFKKIMFIIRRKMCSKMVCLPLIFLDIKFERLHL